MVYVAPPQRPQDTPSRPGHRRTRSHTIGATTESTGPGAFAPVTPPRRKAPRKGFFIEEDESPSPQDDDDDARAAVNPFDATTFDAVPFPSADPDSAGGPSRPGHGSRRPSFSGSIILSSGRPLKSSLKSSASAPQIADDELYSHIYTKSEPATPSIKSVHFRDEDDLTEVKVYNRTGRPANLLLKAGEETETETEMENAFPFPRTPRQLPQWATTVGSHELPYEIDSSVGRTSAIPQSYPDIYANIHLEAVSLPKTRPAVLRGSVLVRNVAFEKQVAVRFTFDNWQTTSEVHCKHVVCLPDLPPPFPRSRTLGDAAAGIASSSSQWDRFSFSISLEDYVEKLGDRVLYIVTRYTAPGVGEWWDNNSHANYRVQFCRAPAPSPAAQGSSSVVTQQKSFVPPSTLRSTPMSASFVPTSESPRPTSAITPAAAYAKTIMGGRLTASPRGSPVVSPRDSPVGSPRMSPRDSPNGSPNSSDNERRAAAAVARSNKATVSSTLGLGVRPSLPTRPANFARSNSSPPVYTPSDGPQFFTAAPRETAKAPGAEGSAPTSPLMARLSKLALSNYARPAAVSPSEHVRSTSMSPTLSSIVGGQPATLDAPHFTITEPSPPAVEPSFKEGNVKPLSTTAASGPMPVAVADSPLSPDGVWSSASTSGDSSPLVGTPPQSASDLPALDESEGPLSPLYLPLKAPMPVPASRVPRRQFRIASSSSSGSGSGSGSESTTPTYLGENGASHHRRLTSDFVIDMPTPIAARGTINSPFSPVSTPRYSLDAALLGAGATGADILSPQHGRGRVGTDDANYAAFIRQWCFARSPSPGTPAAAVEGAAIEVALPRDGSSPRPSPPRTARDSPSGGATPVPFAGRENAWLGLTVERRSWEAGRA